MALGLGLGTGIHYQGDTLSRGAALFWDFEHMGSLPADLTFTRSTAALAFNDSGLMAWAPHNLLLRSQDYSATWAFSTASATASAATAPDGTLTASKLTAGNGVDLTANSAVGGMAQTASVPASSPWCFTIYAKAADVGSIRLREAVQTGARYIVDLSTGVVTAELAGAVAVTASSVGSGWWRVQMVRTTGAAETSCAVNVKQGNTTGDGTSGIYVWGAQLNLGSTALTYVPTTSAAVYQAALARAIPSGRRGYVAQGARTNLLPRSQELNLWDAFGAGVTISANAAAAPDGTTTADRVTFATGGSADFIRKTGLTLANGTSYTFSVWAASVSGNTTLTVDLGNSTTGTATITATPTRYSITIAADATAAANGWLDIEMGGAAVVDLWGAQLEAATFPSLYIPTTTASLSRSADLLTYTLPAGLAAALSTQGTMVVEFSYLGAGSATGAARASMSISPNSTGAGKSVLYNGAGSGRAYLAASDSGDVVDALLASGVNVNAEVAVTAAFSWAANDVALCADGGTVNTSATYSPVPSMTKVTFGADIHPSAYLYGVIHKVWIFTHAMTDAELQAVTA